MEAIIILAFKLGNSLTSTFYPKICAIALRSRVSFRGGTRAVDLVGGASVYQGGPKFEVKHNSRCLQKSKLVDWRGQACRLGEPGPPGPPLAPALVSEHISNQVTKRGSSEKNEVNILS